MLTIDSHSHFYPPAYLHAAANLVHLPGAAGHAARLTTTHLLLAPPPLFSDEVAPAWR
jgi:hypothetical protein